MAMDNYHAKEALHKIENVFKQHFKHIRTIEEKEVNSLRATFIVINYDIKFYITHNEYDILKNKLINSNIFPLIGLQYWYGTDGIGKEVNGRHVKFTLEELRYLNNACDKLEGKIKNTSAKIRADFESIFPN